ncbi:MAG: hypothetical protein IKK78_00415 [Oscillospiraceae bacterium]|nr:hypothetical protein [Oscillospiraceae bacterium]
MYQFSPATERILRMREIIRERIVRYDSERARIVTESNKRNEHVPPMIKRARLLYDLCEQMTILVEDTELIVGNKGPHFFSSPGFPEWGNTDWVVDDVVDRGWELRDGIYYNPPADGIKYCISKEDHEYLSSIMPYWKERKMGTMIDAWKPEGYEELAALEISQYVPKGGMSLFGLPAGHIICGYQKIINMGYGAIRKQAQDWIDEHRGNLMGDDVNKYMFYTAVVITCDGASLLAKRYAAKCEEMAAACTEPARKAELEKMAGGLAWLAENPARDFWEALQGVMLYQVLLQIFEKIPGPAIGRFDQYTWPFLKKDLEEGKLTMEQAQELVDAFFLKLNCYYGAGMPKLVDVTGVGNTYQNTTIGGVDPITGEDASNPVTYMVFETVGRLKMHDPTLVFRTHKGTPDKLWECAIATSKMVGGLPLYYNDDVVIPCMMNEVGYSLEDARNYGCIGCQEIVGSGNDYPMPNGAYPPHATLYWAAIFDMAMNDGLNPLNGVQASMHTGYLYEMNSIEEVRAAVEKMGTYLMRLYISINNYAESLGPFFAPEPLLSMSIEGCMESGKDCTAGGAKYNSFGGTATGLATLADSLATIKYMCFDKKICTTRELYDAYMANWEGHELLRQRILKEVPHFGNNDPYVDEEMAWCVDMYYRICKQLYSTRSKVYKAGLYGSADHIVQGHYTWATPDGRKYPDAIADAASPAQSRDKKGPIQVFNSSNCYDHTKFLGGIALNLRMHPSVLSNDEGIAKLRDMTKAYFANGGMEVQYNVVDTDTLRAAQADPEQYRDLVVRIAGYSAYFVELGRDLQDDIIARNENRI